MQEQTEIPKLKIESQKGANEQERGFPFNVGEVDRGSPEAARPKRGVHQKE